MKKLRSKGLSDLKKILQRDFLRKGESCLRWILSEEKFCVCLFIFRIRAKGLRLVLATLLSFLIFSKLRLLDVSFFFLNLFISFSYFLGLLCDWVQVHSSVLLFFFSSKLVKRPFPFKDNPYRRTDWKRNKKAHFKLSNIKIMLTKMAGILLNWKRKS